MDVGVTEQAALVLREHRGAVAWLRLNRPAGGNLLTTAMLDALHGAIAEADADPAVRVVVLAATGKLFCAGTTSRRSAGTTTPRSTRRCSPGAAR